LLFNAKCKAEGGKTKGVNGKCVNRESCGGELPQAVEEGALMKMLYPYYHEGQ
jgi:hypothetical protein